MNRIACSSSDLYSGLKKFSIFKNSTILPIMDNVRFNVVGQIMHIEGTNLKIQIKDWISVESQGDFDFLVNAQKLIAFLKLLPNQPIVFKKEVGEDKVTIIIDRGKFVFESEDLTKFPKLRLVESEVLASLNQKTFSDAITNCDDFASRDELRPAMTGLFISIDEMKAEFVATDGHRLIRLRRHDITSKNKLEILIDRSTIKTIASIFKSKKEDVHVRVSGNSVEFFNAGISVLVNNMDEKYPNYEKAIPMSNDKVVIFEKKEIINQLELSHLFANKTTHQIILDLSEKECKLKSFDLDFGEESELIINTEFKGEPFQIGFNSNFLANAISNIDSVCIKMSMGEGRTGAVLEPEEKKHGEEIIVLVMPIMLNHLANY